MPGLGPVTRATVISGYGGSPGTNLVNISYNASSDGFPLSYIEQLPKNYNPSHAAPLLVYLHGKSQSSTWVPGGSGNGLTGVINTKDLTGVTLRGVLQNASALGFIVVSPSPRSSSGFYTNSTCGGPQEQDVMDVITSESQRHTIAGVYMLGFSMGAIGAIAFAGHRPGVVQGIALTGTITDVFQDLAYHPSGRTGLASLDCGRWPSSTNTTALQIFSYLSVLRFHPQNFSGVKIWFAAGGRDITATDNASYWPYYYQFNNTLYNSTCNVIASMAEPSNCSLPLQSLENLTPSAYSFRSLWEPVGNHNIGELAVGDMFRYFLGRVGPGCFTSTFPPRTLVACP